MWRCAGDAARQSSFPGAMYDSQPGRSGIRQRIGAGLSAGQPMHVVERWLDDRGAKVRRRFFAAGSPGIPNDRMSPDRHERGRDHDDFRADAAQPIATWIVTGPINWSTVVSVNTGSNRPPCGILKPAPTPPVCPVRQARTAIRLRPSIW